MKKKKKAWNPYHNLYFIAMTMIIIMVLSQSQSLFLIVHLATGHRIQPKTEIAEKLGIIGATLDMNRVN